MIILEDVDFAWEREDINKVTKMWNGGIYVPDIAKNINRPTEEVFLLLMHLGRQGRIKQRKGYFWGS